MTRHVSSRLLKTRKQTNKQTNLSVYIALPKSKSSTSLLPYATPRHFGKTDQVYCIDYSARSLQCTSIVSYGRIGSCDKTGRQDVPYILQSNAMQCNATQPSNVAEVGRGLRCVKQVRTKPRLGQTRLEQTNNFRSVRYGTVLALHSDDIISFTIQLQLQIQTPYDTVHDTCRLFVEFLILKNHKSIKSSKYSTGT